MLKALIDEIENAGMSAEDIAKAKRQLYAAHAAFWFVCLGGALLIAYDLLTR